MKHSAYRKVVVFAVICLLLAGVVLFYLFFKSGRSLYCSASRPRPSAVESWKKALVSTTPPVEPKETFFEDFAISSDETEFIIEHPTVHVPENPFDFEVREMSPVEDLDMSGGTLSLCSIGTAYLSAEQSLEDDAVYRFYDASLQEITDERLAVIETFGTTEAGGNFRFSVFPVVALLFENNGIEDLLFQGVRFFDSFTKKGLSTGHSTVGRNNHYECSTHVPLWHRAPVDVVLEVSCGPSKIFEFAPRVGEGFREGNFQCRLISVFEGVDNSYNTASVSDTITYTFHKAPPGEGISMFVFACQPAAMTMPVTFEFLDADGKAVRGGGSSTSALMRSTLIKDSLENVALIRARYRTCRQRILIHLPYIPGLPEENNVIDDLFNVRVPYVRLRDVSHVGLFLREVLQLNSGSRLGPVPPDSINSVPFPREFRNVTVRDIARFYAEGGDLYVDIDSERLRLEYPMPLVDKLKTLVRKMLWGG